MNQKVWMGVPHASVARARLSNFIACSCLYAVISIFERRSYTWSVSKFYNLSEGSRGFPKNEQRFFLFVYLIAEGKAFLFIPEADLFLSVASIVRARWIYTLKKIERSALSDKGQ